MNRGFKYYFFFVVFLFAITSSCQKDTPVGAEQADTFIKFIDGAGTDIPKDLIKYNNGYALTGSMYIKDSAYQAFVYLTDKFGNRIGNSPTVLGKQFNDNGNKFFEISGGDLLLVGTESKDANSANTDILVCRLNASGNIVWKKNFGGALKEEGYFGMQNNSGHLIVGGYTESSGNGKKDVYVLKLDTNGDIIWSSTFGGTNDDIGYDIIEMNSSLFAVGSTQSFNFIEKQMDVFLISIDNTSGKASNFSLYGDTAINDKGIKLLELPGNELLVLGQVYNTVESNRILVFKTNSALEVKWDTNVPVSGDYEVGSDLFIYNNSINVLGTSYKNSGSDCLLHVLDLNGNVTASSTLSLNGNQECISGLIAEGSLSYLCSSANNDYRQIVFIKKKQFTNSL